MANTDGGTIVLGVSESDSGLIIDGLKNPNKELKTCWDTVNNRSKVSANLLVETDARITDLDGKQVLVIRVPRAGRRQRPVFVGLNPLEGTYRRNFEGDYHCDREEVSRMLADQSLEPADSRIVAKFTMKDLDLASIQQYRNRFSSRTPNHVWLLEDDVGFLAKIGGWRNDRTTNEEGVTVAGLLMFGTEDALNDSSNGLKYHVDYRERPTNYIADRWTDRITPDGTWVPNLFRFFLRVYPKLTEGIKLPFSYLPAATTTPDPNVQTDPIRSGQSPVHEAIQEALVNALIHADYRGMGGVVIDRFEDRMELSNPGTLLVSMEQLFQGAISECRNPSLQRMFQLIGAGDKAGSGIDKIRRGWDSQKWTSPRVGESTNPDRVKFILRMISVIPKESETRLRKLFGADYETLLPAEVQSLVTSDLEGEVSNGRLQLIQKEHPVELTKMLQNLAARGFLEQIGQKRGSSYRLPTWPSSLLPAASSLPPAASSLALGAPPLAPGAPPLAFEAPPFAPVAPPTAQGAPPVSRNATDLAIYSELLEIARPAREKKKLIPSLTRKIVLSLCEGKFVSADQLSQLMDRGKEKLKENFLSEMVASGELELLYPRQPTHPGQAYRTKNGRTEP